MLESPRLVEVSYTQSHRSLAVGQTNPPTVLSSRARQYFPVERGIFPVVERYSASNLNGRDSRL